MDIARITRHLLSTRASVRRAFPASALAAVEAAIKASESLHDGELRFAVEAGLDGAPLFQGQSARDRAIEVFSQLRVWDTEQNNGVLVYLLLADHAVEIVADRGIHARVGEPAWRAICQQMRSDFQGGQYEAGVLRGLRTVTGHLAQHFPPQGHSGNELPDAPVVL